MTNILLFEVVSASNIIPLSAFRQRPQQRIAVCLCAHEPEKLLEGLTGLIGLESEAGVELRIVAVDRSPSSTARIAVLALACAALHEITYVPAPAARDEAVRKAAIEAGSAAVVHRSAKWADPALRGACFSGQSNAQTES
jgi:hypothetical protein